MSLRITRPALVVLVVATAALGACSNPTAPTQSAKPSARSQAVAPDLFQCPDGGWVGSSGKC